MKYAMVILWSLASTVAMAQAPNTLTEKEKKDGWQLLFDGKSTKGWRNYNKTTTGEAWKVADGAIFLDLSSKEDKPKAGGDLITDREFENYEFSVDWKISPCGNSGIIFNVVEDPKYKEVWRTGPEMQVLDNSCHPDAKIPKHRAGNLYDLIASATESVKPAGEWNTARIIFNKGHLELWLNNVKQVETTMFTPEWEAMVKGSKFKSEPDFGKARKGHIALQEHDNKVWFRNIKVREIH